MKKPIKLRRTKQPVPQPEEEEEVGDLNDIPCVDCHRVYALVDGSSNCRCKRCNTLSKHNQEMKFAKVAKKN